MDIKTPISRMELLAPAGDNHAVLAGLAAGADAVYLGGKLFNARQSAANFDLTQLQEATELLHNHGKRIYVTVNTLIADSEMEEALHYLAALYNIGVDAVIIQDLGLLHLARKHIPALELHASTQMTVYNREAALYLKELGITRVVLARELTAAEVAAIAKDVAVEVFVHGALCVCYSGQCLMSSMIGGRSGNRGRCAQPCRMEYQMIQDGQPLPTQGTYLLSPKDLALAELIPELSQAGVRSLKIEGRMKRPEYVYSVVQVYRRLLDRYYENPAAFSVNPNDVQALEETFNRGFSTGYFGGNRNKELMNFQRPNNRGIFLGRIKNLAKTDGRVSLSLEANLELEDKVEIWVSQGGRAAFEIKQLFNLQGQPILTASAGETVSFPLMGKAFSGDRVFKVFSARLHQATAALLAGDDAAFKIPCHLEVDGNVGNALVVIYTDDLGNQGRAETIVPLQIARNRPLTDELLRDQLGRLGTTPFRLETIQNNLKPGLMVPLSELNQARRQAIEELMELRRKPFRHHPVQITTTALFRKPVAFNSSKKSPELSVWVADLESVQEAARARANLIYIGGDELKAYHWTQASFSEAVAIAHQHGARLVIGMPRITREGQRGQWEKYLEQLCELGADGIILSDLGTLRRALEMNGPAIYLNYPLNFFNTASLTELNPRVVQATLSPELTLKQIQDIWQQMPGVRLECLVQGALELMVSEYCPIRTVTGQCTGDHQVCGHTPTFLRDRLNLDFPIVTDSDCRMHLLNSKDLCVYGELDKFIRLPEIRLRLELKTNEARIVGRLVQSYRTAVDQLISGNSIPDSDPIITEFQALTGRGITKGHYFRGVE